MGGQEINVIVTVKSLDELVFQVAPIAKAKLQNLGTLKPGKIVVKSHVNCDTCDNDMQVNFFWCHALQVSEKSEESFVEEIVKVEDEEMVYEEEYLIEELADTHEDTEDFSFKEEKGFEEFFEEGETEVEIEVSTFKEKKASDNNFVIPDTDIVRKIEASRVCDYCGYGRRRRFSRKSFFVHCASHLICKEDSYYSCYACGMTNETINEARCHALSCEERHSFKDQWKKDEEISQDKETSKKLKKYPRAKVLCHICSKNIYKQAMADHMLKHETGKEFPYECNECGKSFGSRDYVRKHLVVHHFPAMAKFRCPKCPAIFAQKHKYDTHVMAKHKIGDIEKVTCLVCGIVLANERNLKEHNFSTHVDPTTKRQYNCHECNKVFYDKRHHKAHMMIHLPEDQRPFKCEKCGKRFVNSYKYKQHVKEHENPDSILRKCEVCGKGYKYANSLKVHMRVHTGEQPYECKFCNRRFADRSHHRVHMKGHENELGIKLTLTAEERRLVNHGVYQPEQLMSQVRIE